MDIPAEPAPLAAPLPGGTASPEVRLQILMAEHASLAASRSMAWNESFSRTGMYLSTLSFAMVAIALVAQASGFGEPFRLFALAVLPVLLFLGVGTQLRMDSSSYHDAFCIVGMNRIRARYLQLAPDLEPIFVTGLTDDLPGIERTMALAPGQSTPATLIAAAPVQVAVLNAAVLAAIVGLTAIQLGLSAPIGLLAGGLSFVLAVAVFAWYQRRVLARLMRSHQALFAGRPAGATDRATAHRD
jgi:hypothetical protein